MLVNAPYPQGTGMHLTVEVGYLIYPTLTASGDRLRRKLISPCPLGRCEVRFGLDDLRFRGCRGWFRPCED